MADTPCVLQAALAVVDAPLFQRLCNLCLRDVPARVFNVDMSPSRHTHLQSMRQRACSVNRNGLRRSEANAVRSVCAWHRAGGQAAIWTPQQMQPQRQQQPETHHLRTCW